MNELLLIDLMGELNPELLQNDYMENDLKREIKPFLKRLFSFIKTSKPQFEISFEDFRLEESINQYVDTDEELGIQKRQSVVKEKEKDTATTETIVITNKSEDNDDVRNFSINDLGFTISIFRRKLRKLIKIISSIAATFIVVTGIIIFIIKHHKSGLKLYEKKVQVIFD